MKIRGNDRYGSGAYQASRGSRKHNGVDICCESEDDVKAVSNGVVTKIGFPYSQAPSANRDKKRLRYVQITDLDGIDVRYFYVSSVVVMGEFVYKGDMIGTNQELGHIYPEITDHWHFEVLMMVNGRKVFLNPEQYLKAVGEKLL
jgi:murein DD-endopeptidase MepM/ murein hydrolase activator NlpD